MQLSVSMIVALAAVASAKQMPHLGALCQLVMHFPGLEQYGKECAKEAYAKRIDLPDVFVGGKFVKPGPDVDSAPEEEVIQEMISRAVVDVGPISQSASGTALDDISNVLNIDGDGSQNGSAALGSFTFDVDSSTVATGGQPTPATPAVEGYAAETYTDTEDAEITYTCPDGSYVGKKQYCIATEENPDVKIGCFSKKKGKKDKWSFYKVGPCPYDYKKSKKMEYEESIVECPPKYEMYTTKKNKYVPTGYGYNIPAEKECRAMQMRTPKCKKDGYVLDDVTEKCTKETYTPGQAAVPGVPGQAGADGTASNEVSLKGESVGSLTTVDLGFEQSAENAPYMLPAMQIKDDTDDEEGTVPPVTPTRTPAEVKLDTKLTANSEDTKTASKANSTVNISSLSKGAKASQEGKTNLTTDVNRAMRKM